MWLDPDRNIHTMSPADWRSVVQFLASASSGGNTFVSPSELAHLAADLDRVEAETYDAILQMQPTDESEAPFINELPSVPLLTPGPSHNLGAMARVPYFGSSGPAA
jgi:hypothetical protein